MSRSGTASAASFFAMVRRLKSSRRPGMLSRYFPELESGARALGASAFVLDGEITIANGDGFSFDALLLLQRIHPAATRVERLARETPALMIAFDLLAGVDG